MTEVKKPKVSTGLAEKELDKAAEQFDAFDKNVKEMTLDRMNMAPKQELESPKIAQKDIENSKDIYLKPHKVIGCQDKFNEKFRSAFQFDKEYVKFIAQNHEIIGDEIEIWTRPYGGMPAEFWKVPVNKPVWGPRYLAEQIKRKSYHRLIMTNTTTQHNQVGTMFGQMAADTVVQRLDALPVSDRKSIFMGASGF